MSKQPYCTVLGILDDGWAGLPDSSRHGLQSAGLIVGAGRTLALVQPHLAAGTTLKDMDGKLGQVPGWIEAAAANGLHTVVLATGDPLCHGMASYLVGKLGADAVTVLPAPSTLQLAFARFQRPWQDYRISTCHTADAGEWQFGTTPENGLYKLIRAIAEYPKVAAFTGPDNNPARLARALLAAGYGEEVRLSVAAKLALPEEQLFPDLSLEQAAAMSFPDPNVVLVERQVADPRAIFGFDDLDFVQRQPEKGLITKLEARALSLAKLGLKPDSVVWDIGAGSGSVGLEASRLCRHGHVYAIEKNEGDAANARENALRFQATNYTLRHGKAPEGLETWPDPDAVFVGGSGGELAALIE
ncbi:MAG: precorrin-6y C5,15-methyltransferase (decarboxylating) subunit CbiE, partial [Betaproteobacteria bacterium]